MLQPHACTQRFRFRILRRTRPFPGRTSARSLSGRIESTWETPSYSFVFCCMFPFRIEAVIKILTFRVFLFLYVFILVESSDALPFQAT